MNHRILLTNLKSTFSEFKKRNNCLKYNGKIIVDGRFIVDGNEVYELFKDINIFNAKDVENVLTKIDGFFSIIFETEDGFLVIGDRVRSYPLFFADNGKGISVSDDAHVLKEQLNLKIQNNIGINEFLLCGYVTGNETLYMGLNQLLPGQYMLLHKGYNKYVVNNYFRYYPKRNSQNKISIEKQTNEYRKIIYQSFARLRDFIVKNDYQPVVPLSGGRDSRLMAVMLKELGLTNIICYTYGTATHWEAKKSKEVAQQLGLKWLFIPYNKHKWKKEYNSLLMKQYLKFSGGLSVRPLLMDFIAVKELFYNKDSRFLFLPGHSLDFIAGSHIPTSLVTVSNPKVDELFKAILTKHYSFLHLLHKEIKFLKNRIKDSLVSLSLNNREKIISAFEYWDWRERQGKWILNTLNIYDFFKSEWYIPFWEISWMQFFMSLPYKYRYKQNFHRMALHHLFPDYFEKAIWITKKRNINDEIKRLIKKIPFIEFPICYFSKVLKLNHKALSSDYGLERYGAFDPGVKSLEEFAKKYSNCTDIKVIFYFFTLDYLLQNSFNLDFLNRRYLKVISALPKRNQ